MIKSIMCRIFFLFKKNLLWIIFYSISFTIFSDFLLAEHYDTPGEGLKYTEFFDTWGKNKFNKRFDNKGDESIEFGDLAIRKDRFYECKDGRNIKSDRRGSSLPISPSQFFKSHNGEDINQVESVLLFTKDSAPALGSDLVRSIIQISLRKKIGYAAWQRQRALFSKEKMISNYLSLYKCVLDLKY
mgnify:CR=1 FL=1